MINGTNGPHYFFYNVAITSASRKEENRARALINMELAKLTKQVRGVPFVYTMDNPLKDNMDNYDEDEAPENTPAPGEIIDDEGQRVPALLAKPAVPVGPANAPAKATPKPAAAAPAKRVASK